MKKLPMRCGMVLAILVGVMVAMAAPASASMVQISGVGVFDTGCPAAPVGYDSLAPIVMSGSLTGCWYTKIESSKDNGAPSGVYLETGREIFIGSLNGGPGGQFGTTYRFEAKYNPDVLTGAEVKGRCQHPIAAGSGTGGFASASGRVDFKDDVATGQLLYRGHVQTP
jgi:hypothetical protein